MGEYIEEGEKKANDEGAQIIQAEGKTKEDPKQKRKRLKKRGRRLNKTRRKPKRSMRKQSNRGRKDQRR